MASPLRWRLVVTLAGSGDPTNDATKGWPADREQIDFRTLVVRAAQDEADGPCRDINFDPTILPTSKAWFGATAYSPAWPLPRLQLTVAAAGIGEQYVDLGMLLLGGII